MIKQAVSSAVLSYFRFWARLALAIHRPNIIGIAGSTGKSSTKQILYAMLRDHTKVGVADGNSESGVSLGLLGLDAQIAGPASWIKRALLAPFKIFHLKAYDHFIVEMATDDPNPPKNMEYLLTIVRPDAAIHLNAQPVHTQQFAGSLDNEQEQLPAEQQLPYIVATIGYEDAKIATKTEASPIVFFGDDPVLHDIYTQLMAKQPNRTILSYGTGEENQLRLQQFAVNESGTDMSFLIDEKSVTVHLAGYVLPQHFQQLVGAALSMARSLGFPVEASTKSLLAHIKLPKGRSSVFAGVNNSAIIDSTYNASAAATLDMLGLVSDLKKQTGRPVVLLLGDMRELGDQAPEEHARLLDAVIPVADHVYAVGPLTKQYLIDPLNRHEAKPAHIRWFESAVEAGTYLKDNLPENALLLAKGSQNTIFLEEAVKLLLADPSDAAKLCRQSPAWIKRKNRFTSGR